MDNVSIANNRLRISIEKTRSMLGPLVKYPRLEVKYLQRPPFLFVHDIVTYVIRNHGFLNGLFSNDELNRNTVKTSKQKRGDFLKKLVVALRSVTGDRIPDCNWNKLANGGLPMTTNTILCSIANAISKKMSCALAIKKVNGAFEIDRKDMGFQKRKRNDEIQLNSEESVDDKMSTGTAIFQESKKRFRELTIWDIDVEDDEFIGNFEALNKNLVQTLDNEYEEEWAEIFTAKSVAAFDNSISRESLSAPAPALELGLEAMDLS